MTAVCNPSANVGCTNSASTMVRAVAPAFMTMLKTWMSSPASTPTMKAPSTRSVLMSTTIFTTPFEVYTSRRGVCQDFANLFICLARLLGVSARYVCGYLYTCPRAQNRAQGEASHAWVEIFLPHFGWKGFDPTHDRESDPRYIKLAVGRDYADIRPISGSFRGKGTKEMKVDVRVDQVEE